MTRAHLLFVFGFGLCAACLASISVAYAAEDPAKTEPLQFDGQLNPYQGNRLGSKPLPPGETPLHSGDWLSINIDPTRLFRVQPAVPNSTQFPDKKAAPLVGFDEDAVPPELLGFYLQFNSNLMLQPVPAVNEDGSPITEAAAVDGCPTKSGTNELDLTKLVRLHSMALRCEIARDVPPKPPADPHTVSAGSVFLCASADQKSLGELLSKYSKWRVVSPVESGCRSIPKDQIAKANGMVIPRSVLGEFHIGKPIEAVTVQTSQDGGPWQSADVSKDETNKNNPQWHAKIPLSEGTLRVKLTMRRQGSGTIERMLAPIRVESVDTHSLVRVQAQLMASNRLRSISFAVAVTPVRRDFFDLGPWHCFLLCTVSPTLIARLAGEDMTNFQIGLGAAVFLTRYIQLNGGLLFGTRDISVGWKADQAWFIGVGLDPFLIAEIKTIQPGRKP